MIESNGRLLSGVRRRFEAWRGRRRKGRRIPDELWQAAVGAAREHGVCRTAQQLHLDYYSLKRRVHGASGTGTVPKGPAPVFVELGLPAGAGTGGIVLELAARDGAKMSARIPDGSELDLVALAEAFWRRRR